MELQDAIKGKSLEEVMCDVLNGKWDHERTKFSLPPLMNLVSTLAFTMLLEVSNSCSQIDMNMLHGSKPLFLPVLKRKFNAYTL